MNLRRYKTGTLLFSIVFLFGFQTAEAQLLKRALQRGANRAVEKKVEKEAEKQTGRMLDSLFKTKDREVKGRDSDSVSAEDQRRGMRMMQEMLGGVNTADLPESFSFDTRIIWESEDEKGKKTEMYMFFEPDGVNFGMSPEPFEGSDFETFTVMNPEDEYIAVFTNSDGQKSLISMPFMTDKMKSYMVDKQEESGEDSEFSIKKTGKTRTISGYSCEEYIITTDEYIQNAWITEDLDVTNGLYSIFQQAYAENKKMGMPDLSQGFPMEVEMTKRKTGKKSYLRTKSVESKNLSLKTADYETMGMGQ